MNFKTYITNIHYSKNNSGLLYGILWLCSFIYGIGSSIKNFLYDKNIIKSKSVDAFVISVGNLTTGGVGKTPIVSEIAKYFISQGKIVAIVSRGYGGKLSNKNTNIISDGNEIFFNAQDSGDEPYWLALNTNAIVITSKNRYNAAKLASEKYNASVIIMDDGFQHRKLKRDLNILLVDSDKQFGNSKQLPAGPLREDIKNIKRADKIVIVSKNTNHQSAEIFASEIKAKENIPVYICKTEPDYIYNIESNEILDKNIKITAMTAIGQPEQFFKFLEDYELENKITFDDHYKYTISDLPDENTTIVTTEKDAVKLKKFNRKNIYAMKLKTSLDIEGLVNINHE